LAIDPDFEITAPLTAPTRLFRETSDVFFAKRDLTALLGGPVDLAFVDGMHRAEFVLRDILNLERHCTLHSVIVVDDVLPEDIAWTTRERQTQAWTGDVYKVIPFLRDHRPDLQIEVFDIEMKGLAVITRLNPGAQLSPARQAQDEAYLASDASALDRIADIRIALAPRPTAEFPECVARFKARRGSLVPTGGGSATDGYLDLLKRSLLNEIYLDDELRLIYLRDCLAGTETFDYRVLHDIRTERADGLKRLKASRQIGQFPDRKIEKSGFSHTMMGRLRLDSLHACLDDILARQIPGDLVECGVWRGGGCILMAGWLKAHGLRDRKVLVADSFEGLPPPTHTEDGTLDLTKEKFPQLAISETAVRDNFAAYNLLDDNVTFLRGWFRDTLHDAPTRQIALLRLDGDLYESTIDAMNALYDRVSPGGIVIVDDYGALEMCRRAVADFFSARHMPLPEMIEIDWTGVYFHKPH
jgi:predicted O-methyltransferase YrrM